MNYGFILQDGSGRTKLDSNYPTFRQVFQTSGTTGTALLGDTIHRGVRINVSPIPLSSDFIVLFRCQSSQDAIRGMRMVTSSGNLVGLDVYSLLKNQTFQVAIARTVHDTLGSFGYGLEIFNSSGVKTYSSNSNILHVGSSLNVSAGSTGTWFNFPNVKQPPWGSNGTWWLTAPNALGWQFVPVPSIGGTLEIADVFNFDIFTSSWGLVSNPRVLIQGVQTQVVTGPTQGRLDVGNQVMSLISMKP